jgi:hypothetical protein
MSAQTSIEVPSVGLTVEVNDVFLGDFFLCKTILFLRDTLTRGERVDAFKRGVDLGINAASYLHGKSEDFQNYAIFSIGHIATHAPSQATHILTHSGFKWALDETEGIFFDKPSASYRSSILSPDVIDLELGSDEAAVPALYEIESEHDNEGNPGLVSYVKAEVRAKSQVLEAAKYLVALA